jgi:hypothetical protein
MFASILSASATAQILCNCDLTRFFRVWFLFLLFYRQQISVLGHFWESRIGMFASATMNDCFFAHFLSFVSQICSSCFFEITHGILLCRHTKYLSSHADVPLSCLVMCRCPVRNKFIHMYSFLKNKITTTIPGESVSWEKQQTQIDAHLSE